MDLKKNILHIKAKGLLEMRLQWRLGKLTTNNNYMYHKASLIKVTWYELRVKTMYFGSPTDPLGLLDQAKPATYNLLLGEEKPS